MSTEQRSHDGIIVGRLVLEPSREGYIWITWVDDGEGMEVEESKLASYLGKFYAENF